MIFPSHVIHKRTVKALEKYDEELLLKVHWLGLLEKEQ